MTALVEVLIPCPGGDLHASDTAYLLPSVTFDCGQEASRTVRTFAQKLAADAVADGRTFEGASSEEAETLGEMLGRIYLRHQVSGWSCTEPFSPDALLADWTVALPIAERCDELYSEVVMRPLVKAAESYSRSGPTAASTSPRKPSSTRSRKR